MIEKRFSWSSTYTWVILILFALFVLYPFWIGIAGSLKSDKEFFRLPAFYPPVHFTLTSYKKAWAEVLGPMWFTLRIALMTMVLSVVFGTIGGYLLAHTRFPGSRLLFIVLVFGIYIPGVSKLIPVIRVIQIFGLYNTSFGVSLAISSIQLPLTTILYRQYFLQFPKSLFEVAEISGADHLQVLRYIVVPLASIPTATVAILAVSAGWNDLLFPLVLISGRVQVVTTAITGLIYEAERYSLFNKLLAGTIIVTIPVTVLYLLFQGRITTGFRQMGEGVK